MMSLTLAVLRDEAEHNVNTNHYTNVSPDQKERIIISS